MKDAKHFKTPMFHQISRRFSYKIYDLEKVKETFSEQEAVNFKTSAAFRNSEEVGFERFYNTMEAVEAAKRRAFTRFTSSTQNQTPTSQSEIVISAGEGRATREMELIWWPNMFKQCQDFGKLTVRFFVSKTTIEVLHASRDLIATVTTPPSCMPTLNKNTTSFERIRYDGKILLRFWVLQPLR